MVLAVLYMVLIVTNKSLTDMMRVLFLAVVFFMPVIGMPLYFFTYVVRQPEEAGSGAVVQVPVS